MHFLSRFLALTILVTIIAQAMLIPVQQQAQTVSIETALSQSKIALKSFPLDFTPLPHDVQKIVLGYLKTGWYTIESEGYKNSDEGGGVSTGPLSCFSPDEKYLAYTYTAQNGCPEVRLVDLSTGGVKKVFKTTERESIGSLAISSDLKFIAAGRFALTSMSEVLRPIVIWNINTGNTVAIEEIPENVAAMAFSSDNKNLITKSQAGVLRIWEYQPDLNDLK